MSRVPGGRREAGLVGGGLRGSRDCKSLLCAPLSSRASLTKHRCKGKTIENVKTGASELQSPSTAADGTSAKLACSTLTLIRRWMLTELERLRANNEGEGGDIGRRLEEKQVGVCLEPKVRRMKECFLLLL